MTGVIPEREWRLSLVHDRSTGDAERLGDAAAALDAQRFVGRTAWLDRFADMLDGRRPERALYVHGPAGVGKSALLRACGRMAHERGRPVVALDGRLVDPDPERLRAELTPAARDGAVVIVDEMDALDAVRFELRAAIASLVSATGVVLLAGRGTPGREWFDGGLDHVLVADSVEPLDHAVAAQLLERRGVVEAAAVESLIRWSSGYPLALAVGASLELARAGRAGAGFGPIGSASLLADAVLERLAGDELVDVDPDVLDVACVVSAVDARLLAATLPGRPTRQGLAQLRSLSVSEPLGSRVVLHRVVRTALRERLRATDPDRYRTIVLRAAAHLRARAVTEDRRYLVELGDLIENRAVHVGFGPSASYFAGEVRDGDVDLIAAANGCDGEPWFAWVRRWVADRPGDVVTVRTLTGELASMAIVGETDRIPAWAADDPAVGPIVAHAAAHGRIAESAFLTSVLFTDPAVPPEEVAEITRVGNAGALLRCLTRVPRFVYVNDVIQRSGMAELGYVELAELRRTSGGRTMMTLLNDSGPDGLAGALHSIVLAEQRDESEPVPTSVAADLLAALRGFHDDDVMGASPLGAGPDRAGSARAAVRRAVEQCFSDAPAEQAMRRALELAYLDPGGGHARSRQLLHMSRATFYRHLRRARQVLLERASAEWRPG